MDPRNGCSSLPKVDIVIPTLNCREMLRECLTRLKHQTYQGPTRILVMDGGSTDGTLQMARAMGCDVVERRGMFSTGLTGARNLALTYSNGDLTWQIDSDNFVADHDVLSLLVEPFMTIDGLQISIPQVGAKEWQAGIDKYFAYDESARINEMALRGRCQGKWVILDDMSYGITNCAMVRTSLFRAVGGYDSDVRVLKRAREQGLSYGVIVYDAFYFHLQAQSWIKWVKKMSGRVRRYGALTPKELEAYFVQSSHDHSYRRDFMSEVIRTFKISMELLQKRHRYWYCGPCILLGWGATMIMEPKSAIRTFLHFL